MRIGLLADLHANRVALEAVLDDLPDVDALVCAGDVVGYGPWPGDCVDALRTRDVSTVAGNHDRAVATGTAFRFNPMAAAGVEHAEERLSDDQLEWIAALPDERSVLDDRVAIVHGHPNDPDRYTYPADFDRDLLAAAGDPDALVLGHTHVQAHEAFGDAVICNPGSVGQPRDGDPRAAYAILDLDTMAVEERRVGYPIDSVVEAVTLEGLPERIGTRLRDGR